MKPIRLIDILRAEAKWTKKQHRKKKRRQAISQNKWEKRWFRQYQRETGKNDLFELIPKNSPYCYKPTGRIIGEMQFEDCTIPRYEIKLCPFWYSIDVPEEEREERESVVAMGQNHIGGCKLLKKTDDDFQGWGLLWDQCKECHLNYGFGDFE